MSKNLRGLSERKGLNDNLFEAVKTAGSIRAEGKEDAFKELSDKFLLGRGTALATASFYDFLHDDSEEKKVFVCNGTACLLSGRQEKLRSALLGSFKDDEIGNVTCLGHCHSNNAYLYNNSTWSAGDIESPLKTEPPTPNLPAEVFTASNAAKPVLLADTGKLSDFYKIPGRYNDDHVLILEEIGLSGLRGRGGAGYPFHLKLKAAAGISTKQKYIVCNADEGDPGAFSDKWLLEKRPHSILFGMLISARIAGARSGVIYIRGEYPEAVSSVRKAIREYESLCEYGNDSYVHVNNFRFYVIEGAGAYICGEETSLLNSIEGLRPEVRTRPPFPAHYGLFGKPTVLSNVETFANLKYILTEGGISWASAGTTDSAGPKLVSLDSGFNRPGLYEVRMGTPLREVFNEMGRGTRFPVKAFQIGGPLGGIVPASAIENLTLDFESFSRSGFLLGHAGVVSVPADFPMIKLLLHLFEFTAKESCGKCFPCRIGSVRGTELLKNAFTRREKINRELFSDLLETLKLGSLCALGSGLPLPVMNALQYFGSELEEFFTSQ